MTAAVIALNKAIKNLTRGPKGTSPSPSPPPSREQTLEHDCSEVQSSVTGESCFMEVSPQERAVILQTREMVSQAVETLVKQRDGAHQHCDKMWKEAMIAHSQDIGMEVPSSPEINDLNNS